MSSAARVTYAVAAAGVIVTTVLMLYASEPWNVDLGRWAMILPFAVLALSPYLVIARLARRLAHDVVKSRALLAVAILVTAPAIFFYVMGFLVEPDAQSGLLFVFLPIYQFLVGALAGMAIWLFVSAARRWRVP